MSSSSSSSKVSAVLCGTGEYTTGFVHGAASVSDKKYGVVALVMFELRRLGKIDDIALVGTNGTKFGAIRKHLEEKISATYNNLDVSVKSYPEDSVACDPIAYKRALDEYPKGSIVTIFTPDDTHFEIAQYAIQKGHHVLVTKPAVKTLAQHIELVKLADAAGVLVMVEYHKRFDPVYADARGKAQRLGDFSYFYSFMSQPKLQLQTFSAWAGKGSDISYYLNSHHIDFHCWMVQGVATPVCVTASAATGIASSHRFNCPQGTEDTITLVTDWTNRSGSHATAVYTASWAAPKGDVHSQQRFHYMSHAGDISVDQAHRGYTVCTDSDGFASINPLYMAYEPDAHGNFAGHHGYGFKSIANFVDAALAINAGTRKARDFDHVLPTLRTTVWATAILEAGRRSLDHHRPIRIIHAPSDLDIRLE